MKRFKSIFKCLPVVLTALLAPILYSCQDDSLLPNGDAGRPEEGLPATVSLKVCLPAMDEQTRALTSEEENYVGSIWVGIFKDDEDGTCAYNHTYNPPTDESSTYGVLYQVGKLMETDIQISGEQLSGKARILAVANAEYYKGIDPTKKNALGMVSKTSLSTLLSGVTSLKQFNDIKVMRNSTNDISLSSGTLLMSGYFDPTDYSSTSTGYPASFKTDGDIPTVDIYPSTSDKPFSLTGAIYMRRLISYNKFNITADDNIDLTLKTWRVMNIPYCSYLVERGSNACTTIANGNNAGLESRIFAMDQDDPESSTRSFEFYQLENKHDAVAYAKTGDDYVGIDPSASVPYDCREREWKNDGLNTGTYKSLVAKNDVNAANNKASYVVLTAELEYWYDKNNDPDATTPVKYSSDIADQLVHRKAEVTYTIHLGYCVGKDAVEKAQDFNCRRNTKYTYNVLIKGVDKIVVEATGTEDQPGAEGTVVDMTADPVVLDAHYNVFNIQLTDTQRRNLHWYMEVPYADVTYIYDSTKSNNDFTTSSECYTWIKFRPTSSEDVLAKYRDNENGLTLENLMSLDDLKDVDGHPNTLDTINDPKGKWYTVFIDEYVYHSDPDGGHAENGGREVLWGNYVDQDDRVINLYDHEMYPSEDTESHYVPALYSFSQRSIQTHYLETAQQESAFGSEHINEVYGLNFCENGQGEGNRVDNRNGRYYGTQYLTNYNWDQWLDFTKGQHIDAAYCSWNKLTLEEASYPVPKLVVYDSSDNGSSQFYLNPNTNLRYRSVVGCLNRNRDLNGDGHIDANEYRWYVPTSEEYVQFAIGQTELPSPLIQFGEHLQTEFSQDTWTDSYPDNHKQLNYHYFTTDDRYFYAEEGMSMGRGQFMLNDYNCQTVCYQVRCIRQLGLNPNESPSTGSEFAYKSSFEKSTGKDGEIYITSTYFTENSIRPSTSNFLPPHNPMSTNSLPPHKFEVAQSACVSITSDDGEISVDGSGHINFHGDHTYDQADEQRWYNSCAKNSICSKYYQAADKSDKGTWRVPNVRELSMMRTEGLAGKIDNACGDGWYMSCTYDYFNVSGLTSGFLFRFFGKRGDEDESIARNCLTNWYWNSANRIHVKCVRDVVEDNDQIQVSSNVKRSR